MLQAFRTGPAARLCSCETIGGWRSESGPPQPPARDHAPPRPNWWSRNWKWFVPVTGLLLLLVVIAFFASISAAVRGVMRNTEPYRFVMERVERDPRVGEALGKPISEGWMPTGNVKVHNGTGQCDLTVPLGGPKGKGSVRVIGTSAAGIWTYTTVEFRPDGSGARIDLLPLASAIEQAP